MSSTKVEFNSNKCMFCTNLYQEYQTYALQSPYIISNYWIICLKCKRLIEDKFGSTLEKSRIGRFVHGRTLED